jgi:Membrane protein TerC, possibly involved in tellurium resistance
VIELLSAINWTAVGQIILIDILLGGDNAVVIALACRNLPPAQRRAGILWGTAGAIFLRVLLIAFAMTLLKIAFLKIVGGLLLIWIGVKLLLKDEGAEAHGHIEGAGSLMGAIRTIIVADLVMSLDNAIAIAGAAQNAPGDHQLAYVIFGLLVSIPLIIWGSTLVLKLIDRFPIVVIAGGALLGWIAGGMIVTDIMWTAWFGAVTSTGKIVTEVVGAAVVVALAWLLNQRSATKAS